MVITTLARAGLSAPVPALGSTVGAVVVPVCVPPVADETGAHIGGTLHADALSGPDGPAATYLSMIEHNARLLTAAMLVASLLPAWRAARLDPIAVLREE